MGKKSGPTPPDPVATANAQATANKDAAIAQQRLNMVDQFTPYGNLIYEELEPQFDQQGYDRAFADYQAKLQNYNARPQFGIGGQDATIGNFVRSPQPTAPNRNDFMNSNIPRFKATTTLSPDQQRMLDLSNKAAVQFGEIGNEQLGKVGDRLSSPLDFSSLGPAPEINEQYREDRYNSILDRMNPMWNQDKSRLESQLLNKGLMRGSEAWNREIDDHNRMITDARLAADQQAGNEMSRQFGLEMAGRNQGINEMVQQRQIPLNELVALTQGQQVQSPNFANTPQAGVQAAPIADSIYANYQAQQQRQNSKNQFNSALMGGLFGLGSAGLGAYGMLGGGGGGYSLASSPFSSGNSIMMR